MPLTQSALLSAQDYVLIEQLQLASQKRTVGLMTGEQRSTAQGGGIEFSDYREYLPGDDVRRVDWPVYLRFRKLLVRLCAEEKEQTLMVILDTSVSMFYGNVEKAHYAKRISGLLAGIALAAGNRVGLLSLGPNLKELLPPQRSRVSLPKVLRILQDVVPERDIDAPLCIRQFASRYGRRSMEVFISDLLFEEWHQCVTGLGASGSESSLIQVLAEAELHPEAEGDVNYLDMESAAEVPLHVDSAMLTAYERELNEYLAQVRKKCHAQGIGHTLISSETSLGHAFHDELRRGGLVC